MSITAIFSWVLSLLSSIPVLGPYLAVAMQWAVALSGIVTALVAIWHAVVLAVGALAKLPGLSGLAGLAASLSTDDTAVEGFVNTYILPLLSQLSLLPLPAVKAQVKQLPQTKV